MRKTIYFFIFNFVIVSIAAYFLFSKEIISIIDDNKTYEVKKPNIVDIDTLDTVAMYKRGILSYNNQKFIYLDYENNIIWKNENTIFADKVYISEDNIYKCSENKVEIVQNHQDYVIAEISEQIINVSREKNKTCIITSQVNNNNSLYILNDKNEMIVENKQFSDLITGVSISDKSEGYCVNTINYKSGKINSKLTYNLIDDLELWSQNFENELIIGTEILNNNVIVIGTENVYYFNSNGKLLWKNKNYSRIKYFEFDDMNERLYILFDNNHRTELLSYSFEGKVKELYKVPNNTKKIKVCDNKVFVYNDNSILMLHDSRYDILYELNEGEIIDFNIESNNIYILLKDKLIKGQISKKTGGIL